MKKIISFFLILIAASLILSSTIPIQQAKATSTTTLTLAVTPRVSKSGKVKFTGYLKSDSVGLDNKTITFYRKKRGQSTFSIITTRNTDINGYYTFSTTSPYANWYTKFVGDEEYSTSQSKALLIQVVTKISLASSVSPKTPEQYTWVTFAGISRDQYGNRLPKAYVTFAVYYRTTTTKYTAGYTGDPLGVVKKQFYISRATKGYKVTVKSRATWSGLSASSTTYFTPK